MISIDDRGNIGRYGFKNGFLNICWLTGWLRRSIPNQEPIQDVVWLQPPTNNLNLCLPIRLENIRLPQSLRDTTPVHFITRLEAEKISANAPSIIARAICYDRPSIQNMPAQIGWKSSIPVGAPVDDFMPISATTDARMTGNMNVAQVAGIVVSKALLPGKSKHSQNHRILTLMIAQHEDIKKALHVRFYGADTEKLYNRLPIGYPILVKGIYAVNPVPVPGAEPVDGIIPVTKFGYIKATSLHPAIRDDIPVGLPKWAENLYQEHEAKAAKQRQPAQPAAVSAIDDL